MLIEFTVGNYRSFKDKKTLRMDASTSVSEHRENLISAGKHKLLRSAGLYGANASGKSNLLRAMGVMASNVFKSVERSSSSSIAVTPYLLNQISEHRPTHFEALFLLDGVRYRYGFEVDKNHFHAEWLFESKKEQEKLLFIRDKDGIRISKGFPEGKGLEIRTKPNTLFLSVCDQFNGEISFRISAWFFMWNLISTEFHNLYRTRTLNHLENQALKSQVMNFLTEFDLGIEDAFTRQEAAKYDAREIVSSVKTIHKKYSELGEIIGQVEFDMEESESSGTNKLFDLSGNLFDCLNNGGLFIADELDAKLHPLMTRAIVRLFNDPATNPNNAQLIFATHDTNLLSYGNFRRDQIYFTEKDQYGATDLYSLAEFKEAGNGKVRKDRSFYKDYMQGRYGAVPHIGNLENLLNPSWQKSKAEANQ